MTATALNQQIFIENAIGQFYNPDGMYDFQCKDLIDAYCIWLWGDWRNTIRPGNANQCFANANSDYFEKIVNDPNDPNQIPQYGDIVMSAGDWLNEFGHIWINKYATPAYMSVIQQNVGGYANTPTQGGILFYDQLGTGPVIGWLRPKLQRDAIASLGDIIQDEIIEGDIMPDQADRIIAAINQLEQNMKAHMNALVITGFKWNGKDNAGLWPIVVENQRRIDAVPTKTMWGVTIERTDENGKKYHTPVIQEIAYLNNAETEQNKKLDDIASQLTPEMIADLISQSQEEAVVKIITDRLQARAMTQDGATAKAIIESQPPQQV